MTRKKRVLLSFLAVTAAFAGFCAAAAATEEAYTSADEEYMRKQAEKYYAPDDPNEEYVDPVTGEIAWQAVPPELKQYIAQKNKAPVQDPSPEKRAAEADITRRSEIRHNINSYRAAAAVDWGIPAVSIQGAAMWGEPELFAAAADMVYEVISRGTEIRIALLTDRADMPEGAIGQLTRPVYDSRGKELLPQATRIFGRYNYYDQAIVWQHVILAGETVKLDNPEEFRTIISLTEQTEPGYILSIHIKKTILIKIPRMRQRG